LFSTDGDPTAPGPLPLGISVVDSSILAFGHVFPRVAHKHRLQMLDHFAEVRRMQQEGGKTAEAVHINILAAVLSSLRALVDAKAGFGQEDVRRAAGKLIIGGR
jgi:hypothetical protein